MDAATVKRPAITSAESAIRNYPSFAKGWGVLRFWSRPPLAKNGAQLHESGYSDIGRKWNGGQDCDAEQATHGRWSGPNDNYQWFNPSLLGATPFERGAIYRRR